MAKKSRRASSQASKGKSKVGISLTATGFDLLSQMAKKTGLSRSELVERIAKGEIAIATDSANTTIAVETAPDTPQQSPTLGATKTKIHVVTGEQQPQQPQEPIPDQVGSSVPLDTYTSLKQKSEEQVSFIDALQKQLSILQPLSEQQTHQIEELEKQLAQQERLAAQQTESYQSLQQQSAQQTHQIEELEKQIKQQKTLAMRQAENYQSIEEQSEQQVHQIEELEQQLALQETLAARQSESYQFLQKHSEQQANRISYLQKQTAELQRFATIGEAYLNKWRNRNFS